MIRLEDKIRDYLAAHLSMLENGLRLINKEVTLNNEFGANGRIDILAQDEFGNYVIIEIKRSDQSARQAIHELFKYTSIINRQLGIIEEKVRAMLVSTTWHELAIPFSEYLQSTPFHTEGFDIDVDTLGSVIACRKFKPVRLNSPLEICRIQVAYFYKDALERDSKAEILSSCLCKLSIQDHALIFMDYTGQSDRVIYPHATYVVFSSPFLILEDDEQNKLKQELNWDNELDDPNENFLVALSYIFNERDDCEIGYPEKLKLISEQWQLRVMVRSGRFASNKLFLNDDALLAEAMRVEGGAAYYLYCVISPRFPQRWSKALTDLNLVAAGNQKWAMILKAIFAEIEQRNDRASVSISIYNPADTHLSLAKLSAGDPAYFPHLEIISKEGAGIRIFWSISLWNGDAINISPDELFSITCETPLRWMASRHFGQQFEFDDSVREAVGIVTPVIETWLPHEGQVTHQELAIQNNVIQRRAVVPTFHDVKVMLSKNKHFFLNYRHFFASFSTGLVN